MTTKIDDDKARTALDYQFKSHDLGKITFREYFRKLLAVLWEDGEGFSGKRPFGNSGWELDLYGGLVAGGFIKGKLDKYNCLDEYDQKAGYAFIKRMIQLMN